MSVCTKPETALGVEPETALGVVRGTALGVEPETALGVVRGTALGVACGVAREMLPRAARLITASSTAAPATAFPDSALERRGSPLLATNDGRQGHPSRPAVLKTPVPTPAHPTPRAIRVRRSPR
jgi:hypothetical protein